MRVLVLSCAAVMMIGNCVAAASQHPLVVYTVNYPLKYFAERIAGEHAQVILPAPPDGDPAFWKPDPNTILSYQNADLILLNGAHYAQWVSQATLPRRKTVDTSKGFKDDYITVTGAVSHSHGPGDKHAHGAVAFTTWLDFSQAARQARAIKDALVRIRPEAAEGFERNYGELERDLLSLDRAVTAILSSMRTRLCIASHPVYQYFARRYGLDLKSVHWEPDTFPSGQQWAELRAIRSEHPATWMIWEREPDPKSVQELKKIGISSLVFDPSANVPLNGDWLSVMRKNVANLKLALQ